MIAEVQLQESHEELGHELAELCALNAAADSLPDLSDVVIESPREVLPPRRKRRRLGASRRPDFAIPQILAWADAHLEATGEWPRQNSGHIGESPGDTWSGVDRALAQGYRGLERGSSLPQLLALHRGVRNRGALPRLTEAQILDWCDAHRARTGRWPRSEDGPIPDAPGETWMGVDSALRMGIRGLPGGASLMRLLAAERGVRNSAEPPPLTEAQILAWADAFDERTGKYPSRTSGPVAEAPGETWGAVDDALMVGRRGLAGGSTLARLLAEQRGVRNNLTLPPLTLEAVLAWADAHHARTGAWPNHDSGPIPGSPGETWASVDRALRRARRGLPVETTLARLLEKERQRGWKCGHLCAPALSIEQILAWADAHHERTGSWPSRKDGAVSPAPNEMWANINAALMQGLRGLPGGSSLARLLMEQRGRRSRKSLPPLKIDAILAWADAHHARTGEWPRYKSGPIPEAPGETWAAVDAALHAGVRGLPGANSIPRLLAEHRGRRNRLGTTRLTPELILQWADAHHARHGCYPTVDAGPVEDSPGDTWDRLHNALRQGFRGLPGGGTLLRLLAEHGRIRHPRAPSPTVSRQQPPVVEPRRDVPAASEEAARLIRAEPLPSEEHAAIAAMEPTAAPCVPPAQETDGRLSPHLEARRPCSLRARPVRPASSH
jgi:hypothetical protein